MAAKPKTETDKRTQSQKFIDKARELETDDRADAFAAKLKAIASAPMPKAKKATAKKR